MAQTEKIQEMSTKELGDLKNEKQNKTKQNRAEQYNSRNENYTRRNQQQNN